MPAGVRIFVKALTYKLQNSTPLPRMLTETGPGDEDEVADEEELELNPGHLGPLQLDLLVTHH